jgi:hypothetical protein
MKNRRVQFVLAALCASLILLFGILVADRAARASAPEAYQYKCVPIISDQFRQDQVQTILNQEAREGWKLASMSSFGHPMSNGTGGTMQGVTTVLVFEKK